MDYAEKGDGSLLQVYTQGDEQALGVLISRHEQRIFSFIISRTKDVDLANDIFQETFVKIIRTVKAGRYDEKGKFLQWAMRIAHNLIMDHFRRQKRMPTMSPTEDFDIFDLIGDDVPNIESKMVQKQIEEDLHQLVDQLPEEQQEVLKMRIFASITFREIAEQTDVSINTALGRMRYALINLRKLMKEQNVNLIP